MVVKRWRICHIDAVAHVRLGLAYDEMMLRHTCVCRNDASHPENPSRLLCVWSRFVETGLHNKCEVMPQVL